jgi:HEAT repeat protein
MSPDNLGRVDQYLDLLFEALYPYFERTLLGAFGPDWQARVLEKFSDFKRMDEDWRQDHRAVFNVIVHSTFWDGAFEGSLRPDDRTRVRELLSTANKSAHKQRHAISTVVVYRTLDNVREILKSIGVKAGVKEGLRPQDEIKLLRHRLAELGVAEDAKPSATDPTRPVSARTPADAPDVLISDSTADVGSLRRHRARRPGGDGSSIPGHVGAERSDKIDSTPNGNPALALARQLLRLDKAGRDPKANARAGAAEELATLGPLLVHVHPVVASNLREKDPGARLRAAAAALGQGLQGAAVRALIDALEDADLDVKKSAVQELRAIGFAAHPAAATLVPFLEHPDSALSSEAAMALTVISSGVAPLTAILESKNCNDPAWKHSEVQYYAIASLSRQLASLGRPTALAQEARQALPALVKAAEDDDPDLRLSAVKVLGQIQGEPVLTLPALCSALRDDKDRDVRWAAALALGEYGEVAAPVVPELIGALADDDVQVRVGAATALGKIGPKAITALPALIRALDDRYEQLQQCAKGALVKIGWKPDPSDPKDVAILASPCWTVKEKNDLLRPPPLRPAVPALVPARRYATAEERETHERALVEARARQEENRRRLEAAVTAWREAGQRGKELRDEPGPNSQ